MFEKITLLVRKLLEDYELESNIEHDVLVHLMAADLYKELVLASANFWPER